MAQLHKDDLVTALDIGSSKVSALIAERNEDGEPLTVLGTGQRESRGVRRGYIADMDATERAVSAGTSAIVAPFQGLTIFIGRRRRSCASARGAGNRRGSAGRR